MNKDILPEVFYIICLAVIFAFILVGATGGIIYLFGGN
jgi:hypothetical protein